jgi:hypothetical protein
MVTNYGKYGKPSKPEVRMECQRYGIKALADTHMTISEITAFSNLHLPTTYEFRSDILAKLDPEEYGFINSDFGDFLARLGAAISICDNYSLGNNPFAGIADRAVFVRWLVSKDSVIGDPASATTCPALLSGATVTAEMTAGITAAMAKSLDAWRDMNYDKGKRPEDVWLEEQSKINKHPKQVHDKKVSMIMTAMASVFVTSVVCAFTVGIKPILTPLAITGFVAGIAVGHTEYPQMLVHSLSNMLNILGTHLFGTDDMNLEHKKARVPQGSLHLPTIGGLSTTSLQHDQWLKKVKRSQKHQRHVPTK